MRYLVVLNGFIALLASTLIGCPGPVGVDSEIKLHGSASMGTPIEKPRITVYEATADGPGSVLHESSGDVQGRFSFKMASVATSVFVCASDGFFNDPSTAALVRLGNAELCTFVADPNNLTTGIVITPWTHLATAQMEALLFFSQAASLEDAFNQAVTALDAFLACGETDLDVVLANPSDPSVETEQEADLTKEALSGLLLGGLSSQAVLISEHMGYSPGVRLTPVSLVLGYAEDLRGNAKLDGMGQNGLVEVEGYGLDSQTFRSGALGFAQGLRHFVQCPRNLTSVRVQDVQDLLRCLSEAPASSLFPDDGNPIDVDGPMVSFVIPTDGATVNGMIDVLIEAADETGVETLTFDEGQDYITNAHNETSGTALHLTGRIDTTQLEDGELALAVTAVDLLGSVSQASLNIIVNNEAPIIEISEPQADAVVSGEVTIEADASSPHGIDAFVLLSPAGLEDDADSVYTVRSTWDTTLESEGLMTIEFAATDTYGHKATKAITVEVDNLRPGQISGTVALDSPVNGASISVLEFDGGIRGEVIASGAVTDGAFSLTMPDSYSGPVLVRVHGTSASYTDLATGQPTYFTRDDELLLIVDYVPSAGGTTLEDLSINGLTTLATNLSVVFLEDEMDFAEARALANRLWGQHLERTEHAEGIDLAHTAAADFLVDPDSEPIESVLVSLVHIGLARFGAEAALSQGLPRTALPSLHMIRLLTRDLEDGVLNGYDGDFEAVYVTPNQQVWLQTNTLRNKLSMAISRWLSGIPLDDGTSGQNASGYTPDNFSVVGGFFDALALDSSQLFGPDPTVGFDRMDPEVEFLTPTDGDPVNSIFEVRAQATDDQGLFVLRFSDGQDHITNRSMFATGNGLELVGQIDSTTLADGPLSISVEALDEVGNTTTATINVTINNNAPAIEIVSPVADSVLEGTATIEAVATSVHQIAEFVIVSPEGLVDTAQSQNLIQASWNTTTEPEGSFVIRVRAVDEHGNEATRSLTVTLDNFSPGTLSGQVALDTPVKDVTVKAVACIDGSRGDVLATSPSSDGAFSIEIPDGYSGPVLLTASGSTARYTDLATGQTVFFARDDELNLIVDYTATKAGTEIDELSVNGLTTLATALTEAYLSEGETFAVAKSLAYQLVGKHLERTSAPDGVGIGKVMPSDFSQDVESDPAERVLSGLFHVGLSRFGANVALSNGLSRTALPSLQLVNLLVEDLQDTVLDGRDGTFPIYITPDNSARLTTNTLRYELAASIAVWLDGRPLPDGTYGQNTSSYRSSHFRIAGGFFDALCDNTSALFGPEVTIPFDRAPPQITFTAPEDGSAVEGTVDIHVQATDNKMLYSFGFAADQAYIVANDPTGSDTELATIGEVDTTLLDDGTLTVTAFAEDEVGNKTSESISLEINNAGPLLTIVSPADGVVVSGTINIESTAADTIGVESIALVSPAGLEDQDTSPERLLVSWDTLTEIEGVFEIEVEATDTEGKTSRQVIEVTVDNFSAGTLAGVISLDTPVFQAFVEAIDYSSGERGEVLSSSTSDDGTFSLPVPDNHNGPVLIRAYSYDRAASYTDIATSRTIVFGPSDELLLLFDYNASSQGTAVEDLSVNALTTLAAWRAKWAHDQGQDLGGAILEAHRLFGQHLERVERPDGIDIARTAVANLSADISQANDDQLRLGLFHVGLGRLGARAAINQGLSKSSLNVLRMLRYLKKDLEDGRLDGEDGSGATVAITPNAAEKLDSYTLRTWLAFNIARWLNNLPLSESSPGTNPTDLKASDFADFDGFLDSLCNNFYTLFAGQPPVSYDRTPPTVEIVAPLDAAVVEGAFTAEVSAADGNYFGFEGDVRGVRLSTPYGVAIEHSRYTEGDAEIEVSGTVDSTVLMDGNLTLTASTVDHVGNTAETSVTVVVNNNPPTISVLRPADNATVAGTVTIEVTASDVVGVSSLTLSSPALQTDQDPSAERLLVTWDTTTAVDGDFVLSFTATDAQGQSASRSVPVFIDNYAPGTLSGFVALETPVMGVIVDAMAFTDDGRGDVLSSDTDGDGTFNLTVPDTYLGPVLVRAHSPSASAAYQDAATGQMVTFSADDELLLLVDYQASSLGTVLSGLSVNGITTAASALAQQMSGSGNDLGQAIAASFELFGQHLKRSPNPDGVDIQHTRPSDLSEDATSDTEERKRVALFHAGLSMYGVDIALRNSMDYSSLSSLKMVGLLGQDLVDGRLDGSNGQSSIFLTADQSFALSTNTCRGELSNAIAAWLIDRKLPGGISRHNASGLSKAQFVSTGGFFDELANNTSELFGPRATVPFDRVAPYVDYFRPSNGDAVSGSFNLRIGAWDPERLYDLDLNIDDDILNVTTDEQNFTEANMVADVDVSDMADGPFYFLASGEDYVGNTTSIELTVVVNQLGPAIEFVQPQTDTVVSGTITIEVSATDHVGVDSLVLAYPPGLTDTDPAPERIVATWDTTTVLDGPKDISVNAVDGRGVSSTAALPVSTENFTDGVVAGAVFLDTPVHNIRVEAIDFNNATRGPIVASADCANGVFSLTIPESHTGPLLLRAHSPTGVANYTELATGSTVTLTTGDELLLVVDYTATAGGTSMVNLSINALSTLATRLATVYHGEGTALGQAIQTAFELFGEHLERPRTPVIDVGRTRIADFSENPEADPLEVQFAGLFHLGLSRWGAEAAVSVGLPPVSYPSLVMLGLLQTDLGDGVLDGLDPSGQPIDVSPDGSIHLSSYTLRNELAEAMDHWLDNVPLAGGGGAQNTSNLRGSHYSQTSGFFDDLSTNDSALFPPTDPPLPYDRFPPQITIIAPIGNPIASGTRYVVEAVASDDSAISSFSAIILGDGSGSLGGDDNGNEDGFEAEIDTSLLSDGTHTIRFTAVDAIGNQASSDATFVVDNHGPALTVSAPTLIGASRSATLTGTVSDVVGPVTNLDFLVNDVPTASTSNPPGSWSKTLTTLPCQADIRVEVKATDAAGHQTSRTVSIDCDELPPARTLDVAQYHPASNVSAVYNATGTSITYSPSGSPLTITWSSPPTLHKYFNRLDYLPAQGRTIASNNLPSLAFTVNDHPQSGAVYTEAQDIEVEYRYSNKQGLGSFTVLRTWTPLAPSSGASYVLPIAYQTLHPSLFQAEAHKIELRLTDDAGNSAIIEHLFNLSVKSPPVWVGDCQLSPELVSHSLPNDNFHLVFTSAQVQVQKGKLRYALNLPQGSLAPTEAVHITPLPSAITTSVTSWRRAVVNYPGAPPVLKDVSGMPTCWQQPHSHRGPDANGNMMNNCTVAEVLGIQGPKEDGHYPSIMYVDGSPAWDDGPAFVDSATGSPVVVDSSLQGVPPLAGSTYALPVDTYYFVEQYLEGQDHTAPWPTVETYDHRERYWDPSSFITAYDYTRQSANLAYEQILDLRAFMNQVRMDLSAIAVEAVHPALPTGDPRDPWGAPLDIVADDSCVDLWYTTTENYD